MASLKIRESSPFYYIQFKALDGKWKTKRTKYRRGIPKDDKDAQAHCQFQTASELSARASEPSEKWESWVPAYFENRVSNLVTRKGYEQSWAWLRLYLHESAVWAPAQLTYPLAINYVPWRLARGGFGRPIKTSTARRDLKVLRLLMTHAVRSGWSSHNHCLRMGIRCEAPKEKPEFTDDQIKLIYSKLSEKEKDWRFVAFRVALETGCRLGETQIDFQNIDFVGKTIMFTKTKNGKPFTTILPDSLIPMLERIAVSGAKKVVTLPPNASSRFSSFFKKISLQTHCFHCTRVTFITRCHRQGIEISKVMRLVNHSSETVHKIYARLNSDDLKPIANKVQFPQPV
jgi:integrase